MFDSQSETYWTCEHSTAYRKAKRLDRLARERWPPDAVGDSMVGTDRFWPLPYDKHWTNVAPVSEELIEGINWWYWQLGRRACCRLVMFLRQGRLHYDYEMDDVWNPHFDDDYDVERVVDFIMAMYGCSRRLAKWMQMRDPSGMDHDLGVVHDREVQEEQERRYRFETMPTIDECAVWPQEL